MRLGAEHGILENVIARFAGDPTKSVSDFVGYVLQSRDGQCATASVELGLTPRELKAWSLTRSLARLAEHKPLDGIEKEASDSIAQSLGRETMGLFVPLDILKSQTGANGVRALTSSVLTGGGYSTISETLGSSMIELLLAQSKVAKLGATSLTGIKGNILIPKQTGGATAYWLTETADVTDSSSAFGQVMLTPHRLAGSMQLTKQLLAQSSNSAEAFVRSGLMAVLASERDSAALDGTGATGQPLGLFNQPGTGTLTFSAAATWDKVLEFEQTVSDANAGSDHLGYLTTPAARRKLKAKLKAAGSELCWQGDSMNGHPAEVSTRALSDRMIYGNWSDLILADWDGMEVLLDHFTLAEKGILRAVVTSFCDVGLRHGAAFCISTDSAAQ